MSEITIAASAHAFTIMFNGLRDHFTFHTSDSGNFGPFSASYAVALHLANGTVTLHDDNTIKVTDLDVVWDTLTLKVCFGPPPDWCIGPFCIIPDPWNGCLVGFPRICPFPTICFPLDLSGLVSEISDVKASLITRYVVDPARTATESDLDAEFAGHPNRWELYIDPVFVHVDPIDVPATVANLIENAIRHAIEDLIPDWLPGWMVDLLWLAIGPIIDVVTGVLGVVGDVADWVSDLLGNQFDLLGLLETAIADYFANQYPIRLFEDPFPVLPASGGLIPVKIPIRNLTASVNSKEMVVGADIG